MIVVGGRGSLGVREASWDRIVELGLAGHTSREIAGLLGIGQSTARHHLAEAGIPGVTRGPRLFGR